MQKWKWMVFLDVVEKLDEGEVNEEKCKHLEAERQKKKNKRHIFPQLKMYFRQENGREKKCKLLEREVQIKQAGWVYTWDLLP